MMVRIGRMGIVLVIAAALAAGQFSAAAGAGYKTVIQFGVNRAADNLDPVTQDANPNIWAFMQIYQQLVRVNVAGDGFIPDLAEHWTVSSDGKTWTFSLRQDAKFSNGDPVTADDVVWSLQRAHDLDGPWQWALDPVQSIVAMNDHTVAIVLKQPWAPFLADVSLFSNSILSAKVFRGATSRGYLEQAGRVGSVHDDGVEEGRRDRHAGQPVLLREGPAADARAAHPVHPGRQRPHDRPPGGRSRRDRLPAVRPGLRAAARSAARRPAQPLDGRRPWCC